MTVKISPILNDAQLSGNGIPLSGGLLYWYQTLTSSPLAVYQDLAGAIPHSNPIVLNTRGEPPSSIWLTAGQTYTAILKDSLGNTIRQIDNISGVNDVATPTVSEWLLLAGAASYVSATSFSVVGDLRATFTTGRRTKSTVTAGTAYSTISSSTYATGVTTVNVLNDATAIDSGISVVYYGFLNPAYPSFNTNAIISSGTKMPFYQLTPPVYWTAVAIQNDSMMRVVTSVDPGGSTVGLTGGSSFANGGHSPILNNVVTSHTHAFTSDATNTDHSHGVSIPLNNAYGQSYGAGGYFIYDGYSASSTGAMSSNATHTHTGTTANTGITNGWQPRYMDFCIGQKS
jgi:hypothetical protein